LKCGHWLDRAAAAIGGMWMWLSSQLKTRPVLPSTIPRFEA
jgi:hypothetical protein